MSLLVQALFPLPPAAKGCHNREYAPNRQTSDARTNGQNRCVPDAHRVHRHHRRCSAPPFAYWYPRDAPDASHWGNNVCLFSYAVDEDVAKVHHSITVTFVIFTSSSGRSLRSVFTCCILSTTSMPSSTSPNTVYSPSKCGVPPTVV